MLYDLQEEQWGKIQESLPDNERKRGEEEQKTIESCSDVDRKDKSTMELVEYRKMIKYS